MLYFVDLEFCSFTSEAGLDLQELMGFVCMDSSHSTKCLVLRFMCNSLPKMESGTRDLIWERLSLVPSIRSSETPHSAL